jgi:hypothetical protein
MKKLFFLFFLPLWGLGGFSFAQSTVTVTPVGADYGEHTVTFLVKWSGAAHNNRVWVWIDYCPVEGDAPGAFQTAVISAASAISGSVLYASTNTRGFFVTANNATVIATLSNATGQFNWCAYGSGDPPKAAVRAEGGYTLQGAQPFTINGTITENTKTFGAGTCIETITDFTGNPEGVVPAPPSLSDLNSPSICSAGAAMLFATVGGGVTGAMTYTWNIGGSQDSNQTNSYTTASLSAGTTYSVTATNANKCKSAPATGTITVNYPGTDGQPAHPVCGCAEGTTDCSGTCKTIAYYTTNDGPCAGVCRTAYVRERNQCGEVVCVSSATYSAPACRGNCAPLYDPTLPLEGEPKTYMPVANAMCRSQCWDYAYESRARAFNYDTSTMTCYCYTATY